METAIFPKCCGLNILAGFPKDNDWYDDNADKIIADIPSKIKDYETGPFGVGYCATGGHSPYVRAHIIAVTDRQLKAKAVLETLGYRVLGQFASGHSVGSEGSAGFYRVYLLGKGFEKETKNGDK